MLSEKDKRRFWEKVQIGNEDECWPWLAHCHSRGYGHFFLNGRQINANRVAWMLTNGEIPEGHYVCHHCDNPRCCNPDHLFIGTQWDNERDKVLKGRSPVGERNGRSKLTAEQVIEIRELWTDKVNNSETSYTLAEKYNVSQSLIGQIVHRQIWKHV